MYFCTVNSLVVIAHQVAPIASRPHAYYLTVFKGSLQDEAFRIFIILLLSIVVIFYNSQAVYMLVLLVDFVEG